MTHNRRLNETVLIDRYPLELGPTHILLVSLGYKLVEDSWSEHGRRTFQHDEDADIVFTRALTRQLRSAGWETDATMLRTYNNIRLKETIEIEPGGAETSGHFLHVFRN
jgi:hypothetical protein